MKIGLIREGKVPTDNRVAFSPAQCKMVEEQFEGVKIRVQTSANRCFSDQEYMRSGIEVVDEVDDCDILLGIKEVPVEQLVAGKTYLFFSHTRKRQPYNRRLLQTIMEKQITLIDYECLEHDDGQRIIGFGFFAGIVGAHNGMMIYGKRTGTFSLGRVYEQRSFRQLIHTYFGLRLPNIKIIVTGSGRVAHGALEIMNLMQVREVEKEDFLEREFTYPVYVHLKGNDLYVRNDGGGYNRSEFHKNPSAFRADFLPYARTGDLLVNGIYWDTSIPRLFEKEDVADPAFRLQVIADVTDDAFGSIPINLGDQSIQDPVYGVDRKTLQKTAPYLPSSIDVMAVGNLPNELPRDASSYFGEQLIKFVLPDLLHGSSKVIERATIVKEGKLTEGFEYLRSFVEGEP